MARPSGRSKVREGTADFEGLLNNLQDWDARKLLDGASKTHAKILKGKPSPETSRKFTDSTNYLLPDETPPTAASEKELGNEYFKNRDFSKAIDCYSRSIALSPTSVAYANRAMSYIKMKRYEEAEVDCTEALNLDDRYVKAYSRRATARKELGKFKASLEDSGFALKLEPSNQELKKLLAETKALYDDEISRKRLPVKRISEVGKETPATPAASVTVHERKVAKKQEHAPSAHVLAARAASLATRTIPEKIATPRTAYELEVSWRLLSSDGIKQANLLKSIPPRSLPQLFKNALSAPMLLEIVKCTSTFFMEEMELAVEILDNLTKVPRFDMIIMCLSSPDRAALRRIWDDVLSVDCVAPELPETLTSLRWRYCIHP